MKKKNPSLVTGALVLLKGGNVALCDLFARPLPLARKSWCLVYRFWYWFNCDSYDSICVVLLNFALTTYWGSITRINKNIPITIALATGGGKFFVPLSNKLTTFVIVKIPIQAAIKYIKTSSQSVILKLYHKTVVTKKAPALSWGFL